MKETMKILKKYRAEQRGNYILFAFFACLFTAVFFLYHMPLEVVLYPAGLCMAIWCLLDIYRFCVYRKEHERRMELTGHIEVTLENLPIPASLLEQDYQQLLSIMAADYGKSLSSLEEKQRDLRFERYSFYPIVKQAAKEGYRSGPVSVQADFGQAQS